MGEKFILSIDAGTTNCKAVIFDTNGRVIGKHSVRMKSFYPNDGWVEQNPYYIISSVKTAILQSIKSARIDPSNIICSGITNQRETTIIWDRNTGVPIHNAIVWQDRRTESIMKNVIYYAPEIKEKTGLRPDPYFSAGKIKWILDNVPGARERASRGELAFGTVDSWILCNFSESSVPATDYTNASRTMLYNIRNLEWDQELLKIFDIPESILPEVYPSLNDFGYITLPELPKIPIYSIIGDQQSALFGHASIYEGMAKNTYGTGSFMLMNTGSHIPESGNLIGTIAYGIDGRKVKYALEGSIFSAGSAIDWVKNLLNIKSYSQFEEMAIKAENGGLYLVPAFAGLGAPYWDPSARGTIIGLNHATGRNDLARTAYESVAYQTEDVLKEMEKLFPVTEIRVDGGLTNSRFLMQFQADLSGHRIVKTDTTEITATGTAYIAGIGAGLWKANQLPAMVSVEKEYMPGTEIDTIKSGYNGWKKAVARSLNWES
jgi:glycerol kinase